MTRKYYAGTGRRIVRCSGDVGLLGIATKTQVSTPFIDRSAALIDRACR
ncbi:MAG: hypothetical protein V4618_14990 [Pseudomonadota bacterium]